MIETSLTKRLRLGEKGSINIIMSESDNCIVVYKQFAVGNKYYVYIYNSISYYNDYMTTAEYNLVDTFNSFSEACKTFNKINNNYIDWLDIYYERARVKDFCMS